LRRHRKRRRRRPPILRRQLDVLRRDLHQLRVPVVSVGHLLGLEPADFRGSQLVVLEVPVGLVDGAVDVVETDAVFVGRLWNHFLD